MADAFELAGAHDADAVTENLSFLQVVGGQDDRFALLSVGDLPGTANRGAEVRL